MLIVVGLALLLPGAALLGAALAWGLSTWCALFASGLVTLGFAAYRARESFASAARGVWIGLALTVGTLGYRVAAVSGAGALSVTVLPGDHGPRIVNTLFPEPDGSMLAAHVIALRGGLADEEGARFPEILARAYARIGDHALPTPAIATYLGLESERAFDTLVLEPRDGTAPTDAVVFLHGYAGNFYVYCWEMAQAVGPGTLTVCPSVSARGDWWSPQGEQTFRATLAYVRSRGARHVVLAGLSNGAAGASVIAARHARELDGLVLISGVSAEAPPAALPTLVVQGSRDRMMGAARARAYAATSRRARYREIAGGHLIFLSRSEQVRPIIAEFLRQPGR